jgi:hypothetical protein
VSNGLEVVSNAFGSIADRNFGCASAPKALPSVYTASMRGMEKKGQSFSKFDYNERL